MSTTPTTFTVPSTAVYRMTDGSAAYRLTEGDVIPMQFAIALGIEGAAYVTPPVFNTAEQAAIEALSGGGGGGGFPFPMAEGVWYDALYAVAGVPGETYSIGADYITGVMILVPVDCTISKIGLIPSEAPSSAASALVGIYALDANGVPAAQVGTTATVAVSDSWTEDIVEVATSISVAAGWYFVCASSDVSLSLVAVYSSMDVIGSPADTNGAAAFGSYYADITGAHTSLPATLAGNGDMIRSNDPAPRIFFQITHAT